jgi:MinD-like ATPase involved in chromosome partitioning or flagellar assembly
LNKPTTFAFVSGKGGVGKTNIASDFAWVCSELGKTVLIDIDFQNQGCTGLFAPHVTFGKHNAYKLICSDTDIGEIDSSGIDSGTDLEFIPAVSWSEGRPTQEQITETVSQEGFADRLENLLQRLHDAGYQTVVFDCHGGLDAVSLAAYEVSDYTMVVTEADSVTFAGTLELLDYYDTESQRRRDSGKPVSQAKFIVNRIPGKFTWNDLEQTYSKYFTGKFGRFTEDRSIFCYIPFEEMLADSFGEYPFHTRLAPKSSFAKKIRYMVYALLGDRVTLPEKVTPKLRGFRGLLGLQTLLMSAAVATLWAVGSDFEANVNLLRALCFMLAAAGLSTAVLSPNYGSNSGVRLGLGCFVVGFLMVSGEVNIEDSGISISQPFVPPGQYQYEADVNGDTRTVSAWVGPFTILFPGEMKLGDVTVSQGEPAPPRFLLLHLLVTPLALVYLFVFFWTTVPQLRPTPLSAGILASPYWQIVERQVSSTESKNTENILKFFAWTSILVFAGFAVLVAYEVVWELTETSIGEDRAERAAITLGLAIGVFQLWYFARAILGVMSIYQDKHRFQKALFRAVSPNLDPWQHLALFKLAVLRLGASLIPILTILGVLLVIAAMIPEFLD